MMLKDYLEYSRDNPRGLWFKERWYGWGWIPVRWQGWATIGAFVVVIFLNGMYLESNIAQGADSSRNDFFTFFGVIVVAASLLLWICFRKGKRPHWNWGDPRKKHVEKRAYFLVSQKAIIMNDKGEILLLKRSAATGGGWSFAGGGLEEGEDAVAGILREIKEETNLEGVDPRAFYAFVSTMRSDNICIGYTCRASGDLKLNWEHDEYRWTTPREALALELTIHARTLVERYLETLERA